MSFDTAHQRRSIEGGAKPRGRNPGGEHCHRDCGTFLIPMCSYVRVSMITSSLLTYYQHILVYRISLFLALAIYWARRREVTLAIQKL